MNIASALAALNQGARMIEGLMPLAQSLGGSTISTVIGAVASTSAIASNILARVNEGKIVATSNDQAELKAMIARLGKMNTALNDAVVKS